MNKTLYIYLALGSLAVSAWAADVKPAADSKPAETKVAPAAKGWSPYQAVKAPDQPAVKQKAWVRTPVDGFVLAQIEAKGLKPSPETDRATFIRRATLDA